jgi:hypothetical protein
MYVEIIASNSRLSRQRELQQRCTTVLSGFSDHGFKACRAILSFVKECPEDPSIARFSFGLIKDGPLIRGDEVDYNYNHLPSLVTDGIFRHENNLAVKEYAMA